MPTIATQETYSIASNRLLTPNIISGIKYFGSIYTINFQDTTQIILFHEILSYRSIIKSHQDNIIIYIIKFCRLVTFYHFLIIITIDNRPYKIAIFGHNCLPTLHIRSIHKVHLTQGVTILYIPYLAKVIKLCCQSCTWYCTINILHTHNRMRFLPILIFTNASFINYIAIIGIFNIQNLLAILRYCY